MVTWSEVSKHASRKSCWVVIRGTIYDLTDFVDYHPGGPNTILKYAGRDATEAFEPIHPSDTLQKHLSPRQNLGPVEGSRSTSKKPLETNTVSGQKKIKLGSIINLRDFEKAASQKLSARAFAYMSTGADDEVSLEWNRKSWQAIRFRPRVLRPVEQVDISTTILGHKYSAPFLICPAGGGKLAHPTGEVLLTKAAGKHNIVHWISNVAGCTQQELADARVSNQGLYWQIYAMNDLVVTEKEIKQAVALGYRGFAFTVDAIRSGKRERDIRVSNAELETTDESADDEDENFANGPTVYRPPIWSTFDWTSAITWLRTLTDLPIAIKGIQCWEDAVLCMEHGAHPWLSNHGGRQLEGAPSALDTLMEIRQYCLEVLTKCDVIVDGGVTRGTDVIKAIALGAKAVGLGRPFLYSLTFGEVGVSRAIGILKHEIETSMALLGVTSLDQLNSSYVDTSALPYAFAAMKSRL